MPIEKEHDAFKEKLRAQFAKDGERKEAAAQKAEQPSLASRLKAKAADLVKGSPAKEEPAKQAQQPAKAPEKQPQKAPPSGREDR